MIKVVVLGASGSVGQQAISVIKENNQLFKLVGFSVHQDLTKAKQIIKNFNIKNYAITDSRNESLIAKNSLTIKQLLAKSKPDVVLNAISGSAGLKASVEVIKHKINLALANKETLVMAGDLIAKLAIKNQVKILPVDSEHNAIYQLIKNENKQDISQLILTASGGPFYGYSQAALSKVTIKQALNHPTWKMGKKISIDSATMFNKGMEVIEAHHLFKVDYSNIKVMINRDSKVHSLVKFIDGSIRAHLGVVSMKLPIINALANRITNYQQSLDLNQELNLKLIPVVKNQFKAIDLAYEVGVKGKEYPLVYCVANEMAVAAFVKQKIKFNQIFEVVNKVIKKYQSKNRFSLASIFKIEEQVRATTLDVLANIGGKK